MTSAVSGIQELELGVVGFGRLVRDYYLPALQTLSAVRIAAIVDPLPESRRIAKKLLPDASIYEDHRLMLERSRLHGVLVATPPSAHLEIWKDTTSYGIPAFVEKPLLLASQISSADDIQGEPRIMIDFNRRFWPNYIRVQQLIKDEAIGTPVQLQFGLHLDVLGWSKVTMHRLNPGEGGVLHDLGCHAIDLATELIGQQPNSVEAFASTGEWTNDQLQLRLAFEGGSSAVCDLVYGKRTREWLTVRGPKGIIRLAEPNMALHLDKNGVSQNRATAFLIDIFTLGYRAFKRSESMGRASIRAALKAFIDSLRTGDPFTPGFNDGFRNALWVAAAGRSAASNGTPEQLSKEYVK